APLGGVGGALDALGAAVGGGDGQGAEGGGVESGEGEGAGGGRAAGRGVAVGAGGRTGPVEDEVGREAEDDRDDQPDEGCSGLHVVSVPGWAGEDWGEGFGKGSVATLRVGARVEA